jgi:hypothetical protein
VLGVELEVLAPGGANTRLSRQVVDLPSPFESRRQIQRLDLALDQRKARMRQRLRQVAQLDRTRVVIDEGVDLRAGSR